jgi:transcriptional regulator with XRE-family HTH domain
MLRNIQPKGVEAGKVWARQCMMARIALGWTQADLSRHSSLSVGLIRKYESPSGPHTIQSTAVLRATFEDHGIRFEITGDDYAVRAPLSSANGD